VGQTSFQPLSKTKTAGRESVELLQVGALSPNRSITLRTSDDLCIAYARSFLPRPWRDPLLWRLSPIGSAELSSSVDENLAQYAYISLARTLFAYRSRQHKLLIQGLNLYRLVISTLQRRLSLSELDQHKPLVETAIALRAFDVSIHAGT